VDDPGSDASQTCRGDSGGPVMIETESGWEVVGVTSWTWRSKSQACDHGSVVAIFGPQTRIALAGMIPSDQ
jgi:secreted trypsin-like serine protease